MIARAKPRLAPGVTWLVLAASLGATVECHRPQAAVDREAACRDFLLNRMATPDGALLTEAKTPRRFLRRAIDETSLAASGVLSESVGLLMLYAVESGDRALLDRQFSLLQARLLSEHGLTFWKLSADLDLTANANASVDDLRIAHALVLAHERWGDGRYLDQALDLGKNLRTLGAPDGVLRDYVSWRDYGPPTVAETASLTYLDLAAMRKLGAYDAAWRPIAARCADVLRGGRTETGLFHATFDPAKGAYDGTKGNMIHQALAATFLADADPDDRRFLDFVKERLADEGRLYAEYDVTTGDATEFFESAGVYAIVAMLARKQGDAALADRLTTRLEDFQDLDQASPLFGAFHDDEVFSFDNLQALRALRADHDSQRTAN